MTVKEFKINYPQYANLEGEALWNMMEEIMFTQGHSHEYIDEQGREKLRFPWTPEDGDGTPIGVFDVVKNETIDGKQRWKPPTKQSAVFIIFDISGNEPIKIMGEPIPLIETNEGLKIYKENKKATD